MSWQYRRVVDDRLVFGVGDHLHRDELGAEGHHVKLGSHLFIRRQHLG